MTKEEIEKQQDMVRNQMLDLYNRDGHLNSKECLTLFKELWLLEEKLNPKEQYRKEIAYLEEKIESGDEMAFLEDDDEDFLQE